MFYDHAKIHVAAGNGGHGSVSFRREKHVPRGGPDGGDGGDGGDVLVVADPQQRDLSHFYRHIHFKAQSGEHGQGARKQGARGSQLEIPVPLGTQVFREDGLLGDLTRPRQTLLVARGGAGGRGNARFVNSVRQAPKFAERGEAGEEGWLDLTLKLMADAGLAGMPNAGKSSLLRRLSNAKPKVADYPFTTLEPMLGVVRVPGDEEATFTVADVPGLLEGASEGVGMGHEFLAHLERCLLILHVVDVTGYYGADPVDNFRAIVGELDAHAPHLGSKPQVVLLNKADAADEDLRRQRVREFTAEIERLRESGHPAFTWAFLEEPAPSDEIVRLVSAATGEGVSALITWVGSFLPALEAMRESEHGWPVTGATLADSEEADGHVVLRPGARGRAFTIERRGDLWVVEGEETGRMVRRFDLDNPDAARYLAERLQRLGVYDALRNRGAEPGDEVDIAGFVFEFQ
jgi:GTPase